MFDYYELLISISVMNVTLEGKQKGATKRCDCSRGSRSRDKVPGLASSNRFISLITQAAKEGRFPLPVLKTNNQKKNNELLNNNCNIRSWDNFKD